MVVPLVLLLKLAWGYRYRLLLLSSVRYYNYYNRNAMSPLMFLLKLAWDCRYRLPLLITVGFMVLDIRMQLDINVQTRRIPRPTPRSRPRPHSSNAEDSSDGQSDGSWVTVEETATDSD